MAEDTIPFIHRVDAATWIGGMISIHRVRQPELQRIDPQQRETLRGIAAERLSITAWTCLVVLVIAGYLKTPEGMLSDASSEIGLRLMIQRAPILCIIVIGLTITAYVVPIKMKCSPKHGEKPSDDSVKY